MSEMKIVEAIVRITATVYEGNPNVLADVDYVSKSIDTMITRLKLIRKDARFIQKTRKDLDAEMQEIIDLVDGQSKQLENFIDSTGKPHPHTDENKEFIRRFRPY